MSKSSAKKKKKEMPFVLPATGLISVRNLSKYLGIDSELLLCSLPDGINIVTINDIGSEISIVSLDELCKPEFTTSIRIIREGIIKSKIPEENVIEDEIVNEESENNGDENGDTEVEDVEDEDVEDEDESPVEKSDESKNPKQRGRKKSKGK